MKHHFELIFLSLLMTGDTKTVTNKQLTDEAIVQPLLYQEAMEEDARTQFGVGFLLLVTYTTICYVIIISKR